ncbi:protein YLS3-like [Quillaja saponaria]|uniref:Protein YLS3-like n=1 Tax=Quillaja saponaria TaxID=32244 RepID=A0AAD7M4G0_QUISA|nr:protein YLS3-like [Quillaja saponaria]
MVSLYSPASVPIFSLILLLHFSFPPTISSQDPSSSSPTMAQCTSQLLPLVPCAPYVQGSAQFPGQSCCGNLRQLYSQEPHCLCLLLNDTALSSFPINSTLALQLPALCSLQVGISACPASISVDLTILLLIFSFLTLKGILHPPSSPASQISFGTNTNSTVAASPVVPAPVAPRPSIMGLGIARNKALKLKMGGFSVMLVAITTFMFTVVPC